VFGIDWSMIQQFLIDKLPWFLSMIIAIVIYEGAKKGARVLIKKTMEHKLKAGFYIAAAASLGLTVYFLLRWLGYL
jgi:hypothetical protein